LNGQWTRRYQIGRFPGTTVIHSFETLGQAIGRTCDSRPLSTSDAELVMAVNAVTDPASAVAVPNQLPKRIFAQK
ncbi:hypothetical protein, partial [Paraburkholderia hospita]|uniref:hypothetical protein n=1 Tax=Paraburkholderia hospita TaxID=169430 RepID=UPI000B660B2B